MPVLLAQVGDIGTCCLEDPQAEQPSIATSAKPYGLDDSREAVSMASNCR